MKDLAAVLLFLAGWSALLLIAGGVAILAEWFAHAWADLWRIALPDDYRGQSLREEEEE